MEFVSHFQALVQNVAAVTFKKPMERSKCPRCKGSGLLAQRMPWDWNQGSASNDPCWFCEGIGVMPIAGLSGFLLGRASSSFHTRDNKTPTRNPINVQLFLGKFPETRSKFVTHKLCDDPKSLLHDFSRVPDWLCGEEFQHFDTPGPQKSGKFKAGKSPKGTPGSRSSSGRLHTKSSRQFHGDGGVPLFSRQLGTSNPPSSSPHATSSSGTATSNSSTPRESRRFEMMPIPVSSTPRSRENSFRPAELPGNENAKEASISKSVSFGTPLRRSFRCSKHFKTPRKERNRIREEAEKLAAERARRKPGAAAVIEIEKSGTQQIETPGSGLWPLKNSTDWTFKLPIFPWVNPSKRAPSSDYSWVNQMVYGSIKDRTTPLPAIPGKAFL